MNLTLNIRSDLAAGQGEVLAVVPVGVVPSPPYMGGLGTLEMEGFILKAVTAWFPTFYLPSSN